MLLSTSQLCAGQAHGNMKSVAGVFESPFMISKYKALGESKDSQIATHRIAVTLPILAGAEF